MSTSAKKIAGAGATTGSPAWSQPGRVVASDASRAFLSIPGSSTSGNLRAYDFGFDIPQTAVVVGIVAEIKCECSQSATSIKDNTIQLVNHQGELIGNNKADALTKWPNDDTVEGAIRSYGGAEDLWGATLTSNIINSTEFGITIVADNTNANSRTAGVDAVWITVYYTEVAIPIVWMVGGGLDGFQLENGAPVYNELVQTVQDNLAANANVSAVLVGAYWRNIEPVETEFNWTRLDGILDEILDANLQFKIMLTPGINCPDWLLNLPGLGLFTTTVQNPNRPDYGEAVSIPIPWDSTYKTKWYNAITALATHLSTGGYLNSCYAVTVSPWAFSSNELHLPKSADDLLAWSALGAVDQLPTVMADTIAHYATAFPTQKLALHTPFNILNDSDLTEAIVLAALNTYEDRIDIQSCALNGKTDLTSSSRYVRGRGWKADYPGIRLGSQSLSSMVLPIDLATERQGTMQLTVDNVLNTGFDAYFEIWHGDGLSTDKCDAIRSLLDGGTYVGGDEGEAGDGSDDGGLVSVQKRRYFRGPIMRRTRKGGMLQPLIRYQSNSE